MTAAASSIRWKQVRMLLPLLLSMLAGLPDDLQAASDAYHPAPAGCPKPATSDDAVTDALVQGNDLYFASRNTRTGIAGIRRHALTGSPDTAPENNIARTDMPLWEASIPKPAERKIFTLGRDRAGRSVTIPLEWTRLSNTQKDLLNSSSQTGRRDGLGAQRVAWLRGERQVEQGGGGLLRRRPAVMGDAEFSSLLLTSAGGKQLLLAAANDGLLHAFDASNGQELFAYLPAALLANVAARTAPNYRSPATPGGALEVGSVAIQGVKQTVLAGSLGGGGRGLFALNLTDAGSFGAAGAGVMFEFTDAEDSGMGNIVGAPRLVRIAARQTTGLVQRPFLISEAGLNASAALFLIGLDKPPAERWREGIHYFRTDAAAPDTTSSRDLGPPALVLAEDGTLAHAWAGDGAGNLWRFSFKADQTASRTKAAGFSVEVRWIFRARASDGAPQAIRSAPRIAHANGGGYIVLFGAGRSEQADVVAYGSRGVESLYAVHDRLAAAAAGTAAAAASRAALAERTMQVATDGSARVTGDPFRYSDSVRGWVLDLPDGEHLAGSLVLAGGHLHAASTVMLADPCLPTQRRAWSVNVLTGLSDSPSIMLQTGAATLRSPLVLELARGSSAPDAFGRRQSARLHAILFQNPGVDGRAPIITQPANEPAGRLSWREIVNWQQIRESSREK